MRWQINTTWRHSLHIIKMFISLVTNASIIKQGQPIVSWPHRSGDNLLILVWAMQHRCDLCRKAVKCFVKYIYVNQSRIIAPTQLCLFHFRSTDMPKWAKDYGDKVRVQLLIHILATELNTSSEFLPGRDESPLITFNEDFLHWKLLS